MKPVTQIPENEKAAKAEAEKAAKKAQAEAKKAEAEAKKAQEKAKKQAEAEAKKAAKEAEKAEAARRKEAERQAREAARMPMQNDVRRPKPETICGRTWAIFDDVSQKKGAPASIGECMEISRELGMNDANTRAEYARWRKFHGITGRIEDPRKVAEKAAREAAKAEAKAKKEAEAKKAIEDIKKTVEANAAKQ